MQTFTFTGTVYYWDGPSTDPANHRTLRTTVAIEAPNKDIAQHIIDHYGMENLTLGDSCPYCHAPVTETDERQFVNGIKPSANQKGCEFCNPGN